MFKKLLSLVLATSMVFSTGTSVFAAESTQTNSRQVALSQSEDLTNQLVNKVDPFVKLNNDGEFYITNEDKLSKLITQEELEIVKNQIVQTNSGIKESLKTSDTFHINQKIKSVTVSEFESNNNQTLYRAASKEGVNKVEWVWFGVRIYLSKSAVNHILNAGVTAGATYIGIKFPGVGKAIATAVSSYLITEFGTGYVSRAIYIDVGLKVPSMLNPGVVGIRTIGFQ
ncbi:hypothetical protein HAHI6034_11780 [Hathewaya histolytica]|uniref:Uncharacterized protein n=1 Tax=Hathewaya histolytica TaxID=1498 RepID=A0A4U9RBH7_HATHI|nr:hypothetical protein [Hathewaya histolytica]VTQ88889.1 Uncharacterised protein [Hathewaya histolytica]